MADEKQSRVDVLRAKLYEKARVVKRIAATEDGKRFMEILRKEFLDRLEADTSEKIVFKAGQADVVAYLMALIALEED